MFLNSNYKYFNGKRPIIVNKVTMEQFSTNIYVPDMNRIQTMNAEDTLAVETRLNQANIERVNTIDRLGNRKYEIDTLGTSTIVIENSLAFEGNKFDFNNKDDIQRAIEQQIGVIVRNSQIMKDINERDFNATGTATTMSPDGSSIQSKLNGSSQSQSTSKTTIIAVSVSFGVLILCVISALLYMLKKRKNTKTFQLKNRNGTTNTATTLPYDDYESKSPNMNKTNEMRTTRVTSAFTLSTQGERY